MKINKSLLSTVGYNVFSTERYALTRSKLVRLNWNLKILEGMGERGEERGEEGRGGTGIFRERSLGARTRTNNKLNSHVTLDWESTFPLHTVYNVPCYFERNLVHRRGCLQACLQLSPHVLQTDRQTLSTGSDVPTLLHWHLPSISLLSGAKPHFL